MCHLWYWMTKEIVNKKNIKVTWGQPLHWKKSLKRYPFEVSFKVQLNLKRTILEIIKLINVLLSFNTTSDTFHCEIISVPQPLLRKWRVDPYTNHWHHRIYLNKSLVYIWMSH
jgi:hypothetical protein